MESGHISLRSVKGKNKNWLIQSCIQYTCTCLIYILVLVSMPWNVLFQCGSASVGVPCPCVIEKNEDFDPGRGYSSGGSRDGWSDPAHDPYGVWRLYHTDDSPPPQHHHGLYKVRCVNIRDYCTFVVHLQA